MGLIDNLIGAGVPSQLADFLVPDINTTEAAFPILWNGSQVYSKAFSGLTGPNNSEVTVAHGISGMDKLIFAFACGEAASNAWSPAPNGTNDSDANSVMFSLDSTNFELSSSDDMSGSTYSGFVLYTKSSGSENLRQKVMGYGVNSELAKQLVPDITTTTIEVPYRRQGKQVYCRGITGHTLPNATSNSVAHGFPTGYEPLYFGGGAKGGSDWISIPSGENNSGVSDLNISASDGTSLSLSSAANLSGYVGEIICFFTID